jgi:hypothetical protein
MELSMNTIKQIIALSSCLFVAHAMHACISPYLQDNITNITNINESVFVKLNQFNDFIDGYATVRASTSVTVNTDSIEEHAEVKKQEYFIALLKQQTDIMLKATMEYVQCNKQWHFARQYDMHHKELSCQEYAYALQLTIDNLDALKRKLAWIQDSCQKQIDGNKYAYGWCGRSITQWCKDGAKAMIVTLGFTDATIGFYDCMFQLIGHPQGISPLIQSCRTDKNGYIVVGLLAVMSTAWFSAVHEDPFGTEEYMYQYQKACFYKPNEELQKVIDLVKELTISIDLELAQLAPLHNRQA